MSYDFFSSESVLSIFQMVSNLATLLHLTSVAQLDAASDSSDWRPGGRGFNLLVSSLSWRLIMKYFYGHSLPSADSRRAVVSFWRKNVHNTG